MQDVRIVYAKPDGGVSVVIPAWSGQRDGESDDAFLGRVISLAVPEGTVYHILPTSDLPAYDSATRERWRLENGRVVIGPAPPKPEPSPDSGSDLVAALLARIAAAEAAATAAQAKIDAVLASIATAEKRIES